MMAEAVWRVVALTEATVQGSFMCRAQCLGSLQGRPRCERGGRGRWGRAEKRDLEVCGGDRCGCGRYSGVWIVDRLSRSTVVSPLLTTVCTLYRTSSPRPPYP